MNLLSRVLRFLDHQPFPALVCDAQRQITFANPPLSDLCGYLNEELIGQVPGKLLQGPDTDPLTVREVREKLPSATPFGFSITIYHKDGHAYFVGVFVIPILTGERSERFDIGICRELESVDEQPLDKRIPAFSKAFADILDLVRSG